MKGNGNISLFEVRKKNMYQLFNYNEEYNELSDHMQIELFRYYADGFNLLSEGGCDEARKGCCQGFLGYCVKVGVQPIGDTKSLFQKVVKKLDGRNYIIYPIYKYNDAIEEYSISSVIGEHKGTFAGVITVSKLDIRAFYQVGRITNKVIQELEYAMEARVVSFGKQV